MDWVGTTLKWICFPFLTSCLCCKMWWTLVLMSESPFFRSLLRVTSNARHTGATLLALVRMPQMQQLRKSRYFQVKTRGCSWSSKVGSPSWELTYPFPERQFWVEDFPLPVWVGYGFVPGTLEVAVSGVALMVFTRKAQAEKTGKRRWPQFLVTEKVDGTTGGGPENGVDRNIFFFKV